MKRAGTVRVSDLNPHLMCVLCGGYYVDATTIIECLHSFCKACIVRYLDSSKFCPICDVQVHKTKPLMNIRPDPALQTLVYKLVPGLVTREILKRRKFYRGVNADKCTDGEEAPSDGCSSENYGVAADDTISISLQLSTDGKVTHQDKSKKRGKDTKTETFLQKRYLLCPADFTIGHVKKFIRLKLDLSPSLEVDVFHVDETLSDSYALLDISYIYKWSKLEPFPLYFCVYQNTSKRTKRDIKTPAVDAPGAEVPSAPPPNVKPHDNQEISKKKIKKHESSPPPKAAKRKLEEELSKAPSTSETCVTSEQEIPKPKPADRQLDDTIAERSSNGCKISTSSSGKSIVVSIPKHLLENSGSEKEKRKKSKKKDHHHHRHHHKHHRRQSREERKKRRESQEQAHSGAETSPESIDVDAKTSLGGGENTSQTVLVKNTECDVQIDSEMTLERRGVMPVPADVPEDKEKCSVVSLPNAKTGQNDHDKSNKQSNQTTTTDRNVVYREPVLDQLQKEWLKSQKLSASDEVKSDQGASTTRHNVNENKPVESKRSPQKVEDDIASPVTPTKTIPTMKKDSEAVKNKLKQTTDKLAKVANGGHIPSTEKPPVEITKPQNDKTSQPTEQSTSAKVMGDKPVVSAKNVDKHKIVTKTSESSNRQIDIDKSADKKPQNILQISPSDKKSNSSNGQQAQTTKLYKTTKLFKPQQDSQRSNEAKPSPVREVVTSLPKSASSESDGTGSVSIRRQTTQQRSTLAGQGALMQHEARSASMPWKSLTSLAEAGRKVQESADSALGRTSPSTATFRIPSESNRLEDKCSNGYASVVAQPSSDKKDTSLTSSVSPFTDSNSTFESPSVPKGIKTYSKKEKMVYTNTGLFAQPFPYGSAFTPFASCHSTDAIYDRTHIRTTESYKYTGPALAAPKRPKVFIPPVSTPQKQIHGHKVIGQLNMVYESIHKPSYSELTRKFSKQVNTLKRSEPLALDTMQERNKPLTLTTYKPESSHSRNENNGNTKSTDLPGRDEGSREKDKLLNGLGIGAVVLNKTDDSSDSLATAQNVGKPRGQCEASFSATHKASSPPHQPHVCGASSPTDSLCLKCSPRPRSTSPHMPSCHRNHYTGLSASTRAMLSPRDYSLADRPFTAHPPCSRATPGGQSPQNNNISAAAAFDPNMPCDQCYAAVSNPGEHSLFAKSAPQEVPLDLHKPRNHINN